MSRAFVKESDQDSTALPELEQSPHPNFVTARGLAALESRVRALEVERTDARAAGDDAALARVARDLRYYQSRRDSARLVEPAAEPTVVRFGVRVYLACPDGQKRAYRIVGEDESDPPAGLLSYVSPLAKALIGLEAGDEVRLAGQLAIIERLER